MTASSRSFATAETMAEAVATLIIDGVVAAKAEGRDFLLGCPGGRTPQPVYQAWARRAAEADLDCSNVVIVMMDDYLDRTASTPATVPDHVHFSCRRFAEVEIRDLVNQGLSPSNQVPDENVWLPDPIEPDAYDRKIAEAGGVDLFLVASGASDGHVAFCGPGADLDGRTSIVELAPRTRIDNMVTFPGFNSLDDVPTHGISVGLGTIRQLSHTVLLLLHGADKRRSAQMVAGGVYVSEWPATFIHRCENGETWIDASAEGEP